HEHQWRNEYLAWEERVKPSVDKFILAGHAIETEVNRRRFSKEYIRFMNEFGIVPERKPNNGGSSGGWLLEHHDGPLTIGWSNDFAGGNSFYVNDWEVYNSNDGWFPNSGDAI